MDRVVAIHAGSQGFNSQQRHMSERFLLSNRPGYPHPVCSELEKSGIRVGVCDYGVNEHRWWCQSYQTGKTVHLHTKTLQTQGQTHGAGCAQQWYHTAEPLREHRYKKMVVVIVVLLYIHGKHLRSCQDGQLT